MEKKNIIFASIRNILSPDFRGPEPYRSVLGDGCYVTIAIRVPKSRTINYQTIYTYVFHILNAHIAVTDRHKEVCEPAGLAKNYALSHQNDLRTCIKINKKLKSKQYNK